MASLLPVSDPLGWSDQYKHSTAMSLQHLIGEFSGVKHLGWAPCRDRDVRNGGRMGKYPAVHLHLHSRAFIRVDLHK